MGKTDFTSYVTLTLFLYVSINMESALAQNLSQYYNQSCEKQLCNKEMKPVTESYVYVLLVCYDKRCLCPNKYELKGKMLNATGYEWQEDLGQCLMSVSSECTGLAKGLCASGNCVEGRCAKKTVTRRDVENQDDSSAHCCINFLLLFLVTSVQTWVY